MCMCDHAIMKRCLVLLLLAVSARGCGSKPESLSALDRLVANRPLMPADIAAVAEKNNRYDLFVRLQLASIEVPVGTASNSEEIWSYLDEEAVRRISMRSLSSNGLRIGRGHQESWPDLAKILRRMTGRKLQESNMITVPGKVVPITLKSSQPMQTIFLIRQDRTLQGFDCPPGDNLLAIACTLDEDDPSKVLITGVPQIRAIRHKTRFVKPKGRLMMIHSPNIYSLTPLTFQVVVPSKDFLVLGPGAGSDRLSSVGHHFFIKQKDGVQFETILVLKPEVFATPVRTPKPMRLQR